MPADDLRWEASPATTQQGTSCALQVEVPAFNLSFQAQFYLRPQQRDHIFGQFEDFLLDFVGEFGDDAEPLDCHGTQEKLAEVGRKAREELDAWQERLKASDVMKAKVDRMTQQINSMRTAHLKEVTWLKEQLYSKARAEKEGREFHPEGEVHFHSARLAFEEEVHDLASERLVAMRTDHELQMKGMEEKYLNRVHLLTEQLQTAKMVITRKDKLLQMLQGAVPRGIVIEDPQEGSLESPRAAEATCEGSDCQSTRQACLSRSFSGEIAPELGGEAPERTPEDVLLSPEEFPSPKVRARSNSNGRRSLNEEGLSSQLITPPPRPSGKKTGAARRHSSTNKSSGRRASAPVVSASGGGGVVDVGVGTGPYEEFFAVRLADAGSQTDIDQKLLDYAMRYSENMAEDAWSNLLGHDDAVQPDHEAALREPDYKAVVPPSPVGNLPVDKVRAPEEEPVPEVLVGRAGTPTTALGSDHQSGDRAPSSSSSTSGCCHACVGSLVTGRGITTVEQEIQCNMHRVVMLSPLEKWLRCDEDPVDVQLQQIADLAVDVENKVEEMSARVRRLMGQATVSQREQHQATLKRLARLAPDVASLCDAPDIPATAAPVQEDLGRPVPATSVDATRTQMARALAVQERSSIVAKGVGQVSDILGRHGIAMGAPTDADPGSAAAPMAATSSGNQRSTWRSKAGAGRRLSGSLEKAPTFGVSTVSELPTRLTAEHRLVLVGAAQTVSELPAPSTVRRRLAPPSPGQVSAGDQLRGDMVAKISGESKLEGRPRPCRPSIASMGLTSMLPMASGTSAGSAKPPEAARGPRPAGPGGQLQGLELDPECQHVGGTSSEDEMSDATSMKPKPGRRSCVSHQRRRSDGDVLMRPTTSYATTFREKFMQRVHFTQGSEASAAASQRSFAPMGISTFGLKRPKSSGDVAGLAHDIERDRNSEEFESVTPTTCASTPAAMSGSAPRGGSSFAQRDSDKDKAEAEKECANGRTKGRRTNGADKATCRVSGSGQGTAVEPAPALDPAESEAMADVTGESPTSPTASSVASPGASHTPRLGASLRGPSRSAGVVQSALPPITAAGTAAGGGAGGLRHSVMTPRK